MCVYLYMINHLRINPFPLPVLVGCVAPHQVVYTTHNYAGMFQNWVNHSLLSTTKPLIPPGRVCALLADGHLREEKGLRPWKRNRCMWTWTPSSSSGMAAGKMTGSPLANPMAGLRSHVGCQALVHGDPWRTVGDRSSEVNFRRLRAAASLAGDPDFEFLGAVASDGVPIGRGEAEVVAGADRGRFPRDHCGKLAGPRKKSVVISAHPRCQWFSSYAGVAQRKKCWKSPAGLLAMSTLTHHFVEKVKSQFLMLNPPFCLLKPLLS